MSDANVGYLMNKLYTISKDLGGPSEREMKEVNKDDFIRINSLVLESLHSIRKKQQERDQKREKSGRSAEVLRLSGDIRDQISEIAGQLAEMNEVLRKQVKSKKIPNKEVENRQNIINKLRDLHSNIESFERGGGQLNEEKMQTLTELKQVGPGSKNNYQNRDMTAQEKQALERWKQQDKDLDSMLDQIDEGVTQWKEKAQAIGTQIDRTNILIEQVNDEVNKTEKALTSANQKLKDVIKQARSPQKFCMDVVLICIILGIVGVIYNIVRKK